MNSAKADSHDDEPPISSPVRKRKTAGGNGVWSHALIIMGMAVAGLLVAMLLIGYQVVASGNAIHQARQAENLTAQYAAFFNGKLKELQNHVSAMAAAPQTVAAFSSFDDTILARTGDELQAAASFARNVKLIPKGEAEVNNRIGIGYVAVDVIERAETQPYVGPDGIGGQRPQLFVAHSVLKDGVVAGVLFVDVSMDYFLTPLSSFNPALGKLNLDQRFEGAAAVTLLEWGDAGAGTQKERLRLNAPHWSLMFTPNPDRVGQVSSSLNMLMAFGVAAGMMLGGVLFGFASLNRKLEQDADALLVYAGRVMRGRNVTPETYRLPLFRQTAGEIARLADAAKGGGRPDRGEEPQKASAKAGKRKRGAKVKEAEPARTTSDVDDLLADDSTGDEHASGDDDEFLDVSGSPAADDNFGIEVSEDVGPIDMGLKLDPEIFRAYDIRGITTSNLTEDVVYWIGRAFAAEAKDRKQTRVAVGRDGRHSSAGLRDELARGLTEGGMDVLDIGEVPTPLLYFATYTLDTGTGIMITGSHNPPDYNGLKMVMAGETLADDRIQKLRERIEANSLSEGDGDLEEIALNDHYIDRVLEDVVVAQPLKVVVDCGNGVAGVIAPELISQLGCEVVPLYCDVDGDFPNHHPDPAEPENLEDLITVVAAEKADLGLAFDGDGDRLGLVTSSGEIIYADKLLMLFAQDIVGRNPGADIIYDVKCSRHLNSLISDLGGRPIMWKTGHSHMKAKLKETGALLAGELSGHICFGERWYGFDDALYSAARLLEIVGGSEQSADELFRQFPITFSTPEIKIASTESEKFKIMERLVKEADFGDGTLTTIDGVRVDYADGWGLVRPSNTSPILSLRFEADSQEALDRIQDLFRAQLLKFR